MFTDTQHWTNDDGICFPGVVEREEWRNYKGQNVDIPDGRGDKDGKGGRDRQNPAGETPGESKEWGIDVAEGEKNDKNQNAYL